jgi:trehalose-phosphatase
MRDILALVPAGAPLAIFLDYDGTLVRIRERPELARLGPKRRAELARLGRRAKVAVVSGRPLAEVRRLVGVPGLAYVGNHGLEIRADGRTWVHPEAARRVGAVGRTVSAIEARISDLPGVFVEDKGLTASVHYRMARPRLRGPLHDIVAEEVGRSRGRVVLSQGKKVFEIRPNVPWDKGRGVRRLMLRAGFAGPRFPIYIGDDRTDEDAFRALGDRGLTIRVGSCRGTAARHCLGAVKDVWKLLAALGAR